MKHCLFLSLLVAHSGALSASATFNIESLNSMSLKELMNIQVKTASRTEQNKAMAPANITVVTPRTIELRGYQNLIDILRDIPGFDFSNYQDSAGEYTSHSINRGIGGTPGNVQLLVMVDGIPQNHIAFNWSQPWGNQQIYSDLERIEIIQGPGSASYGANAYSGIVHFITKTASDGQTASISSYFGEHNSRSHSLFLAHNASELTLQLAARKYSTHGDKGLESYDPMGYFSPHLYPNFLEHNYTQSGKFVVNGSSPRRGDTSLPGYNNQSDDWALRAKISWQAKNPSNTGLTLLDFGFSRWDQKQGLGSYVTGFEYQTRDASYLKHHQADYQYINADYRITSDILLQTKYWHRTNSQLPDTGFKYSYRFVDLVKSYHSENKQSAFEQQLEINHLFDINWLIGYRLMSSDKMNQVVSLGRIQKGQLATTSSDWYKALNGEGLNQYSEYDIEQIKEKALFAQAQGQLNSRFHYTLGLRYDHSESYGTTVNPRLALSYNMHEQSDDTLWVIKYLYGEAFREPSVFELQDEFRGNDGLRPEEISTHEVVSNWSTKIQSTEVNVKSAIFYSQQHNNIGLAAINNQAGSRYVNGNSSNIWGLTLDSQFKLSEQTGVYANYHFTDGDHGISNAALSHTAKHKINWGVNYQAFSEKLNINLRFNHLIKRQSPDSNLYFKHYDHNLTLANLAITWQDLSLAGIYIKPQLLVTNLFDKQYVMLGRQDGSSDIKRFDPNTNINPVGFTPPYHPQLGREFALQIGINF